MTDKITIVSADRPETASDEAACWLVAIRNALTGRQTFAFDSGDFVECSACAAKSGSPTLCWACLANRHIVGMLQRELRAARVACTAALELRDGDGMDAFPRSDLWPALEAWEKSQ